MGAKTIGTGTNRDTLERLREYGLSVPVQIDNGPISAAVRRALGGRGVDLVIDTIGGSALIEGMAALEDGGRAVLVGGYAGLPPVDSSQILMRRLSLIGCFLGQVIAHPDVHGLIASLFSRVSQGELSVPIDATFQLSEAEAAHRHAERRGRIGRVAMLA